MYYNKLNSPTETVLALGPLSTPRPTNQGFFVSKQRYNVLLYTICVCFTILLLVGSLTLQFRAQNEPQQQQHASALRNQQQQLDQTENVTAEPVTESTTASPGIQMVNKDKGSNVSGKPTIVNIPEMKEKPVGKALHLEHSNNSLEIEEKACVILPSEGPYAPRARRLGSPIQLRLEENDNYDILFKSIHGPVFGDSWMVAECYHDRRIRKFFGFLSAPEFFDVASWARESIPDAVFISPTVVSPLLQYTTNFFSLQPPPQKLMAALHDLVTPQRLLVVTEASIHDDALSSMIKLSGMDVYGRVMFQEDSEWDDVIDLLVRLRKKCRNCPIVMITGSLTHPFIEKAEKRIRATWILPLPNQYEPQLSYNNSEIISIQFRSFHKETTGFLQPLKYIGIEESLAQSSLEALVSKERPSEPLGSYVVLFHSYLLENSEDQILGLRKGWLPIYEYDLVDDRLSRRLLDDLLIDKDFVENLLGKNVEECTIVSRFISQMTGELVTEKRNANRRINVPIEKGAQIHIDCKDQHADLRCPSGEGFCYGVLEDHRFGHNCTEKVEVSIGASKSCALPVGVTCLKGLFGCHLEGLCYARSDNVKFTCQGDVLS